MSELIAEARVLVTPDTTGFRAALEAQVIAAAKGVTVAVPVTAVATGSGAAQAEFVAGARAGQEAAARLATSTSAVNSVRTQFARTETLVADAEKRAAVATTEAAAASIRYGAAVTASRAAQDAYRIALTQTDEVLRLQAGLVVGITAENERLALSQLTVARTSQAEAAALGKAAAAQSAGLGGIAKGGSSAAASLLGVRGATLAATGPFIAGAAGAIAFSKAIGIATSFNSQLAVFAETTGATADEMERVSEAAKQLGKDITLPGVSASDAAEAMTEFAKAGLSVSDAIAATRGGLQLATAAQLSNADAVTLAANALNSFKLSGDQAVNVADTLANAANAAQGSIADIGLGLRQSASAAAAVGVSFEDTTALLTLLAKNGLTASDAGTSLRTAFIRLVNPSKAAQKVLSDLNINLRDAAGNVRPEVFAEFAQAQQNLARSTQDANTAIVFGQDAFRAQAVLGREGIKSLNDTRDALEETGTAARVAGARMTGLKGSTANLANQMEALGLTIGQKATPALEVLVDNLADFAEGANNAIAKAEGFAAALSQIGSGQDQQQDPFKQVKEIGSFLVGTNIFNIKSQIEKLVEGPKEEMLSAGAEIASSIEDAGRIAARGAVPFADQITGALDDAFALINSTLAKAAKNFRSGQFAAVARAGGQQSGLEEQFNQILASGGSLQAQIANLQKQAAAQAKIIAKAGPNAQGDLLKARRAAQAKLASINQQITSIENQIASGQESAAAAQQQARDRAKQARDQQFLDAQQDARDQAQRRVNQAQDTPALTDDIKRQQQLRTLIKKQIASIKASTLDEAAKQQALRALRKARDATTDEINSLIATDKKNRAAARQQAAEEALQANDALAQSILDLTGNKNPLLRALDAEIKNQITLRNKAKKGSTAFKEAQTEINNLLVRRRELLKGTNQAAKEAAQGFSGFEFLQKTQGFAANLLGNLIPGFATGGLVGNTTAVQGQITDPGLGFQAEVPFGNQLDRANQRGVRPVQVDTTNALLRQILAAVSGRHTNPPEVRQNWRTAFAELDTL